MPTITQLSYLLAVEKHGHFGRAAAALDVSQPTLSSQVQKVETELETPIFNRRSKPIQATEAGKVILKLAAEVVAVHSNLMAAASGDKGKVEGPFTLALIPTLAPYVLPWFVKSFSERYASVQLQVVELTTDEIISEIAANRVDAGILATPLGEGGLVEHRLFYDPFYVYAHPDESILKNEGMDPSALDAEHLWLLDDGHCFRAQVINLCGMGKQSNLPNVVFAGGSFETIKNLIDQTSGYTLIPETFARTLPWEVRNRQVRSFSTRVPTREVSLVHHSKTWKTSIVSALAELVQETLPAAFSPTLADEEVLPIRLS